MLSSEPEADEAKCKDNEDEEADENEEKDDDGGDGGEKPLNRTSVEKGHPSSTEIPW